MLSPGAAIPWPSAGAVWGSTWDSSSARWSTLSFAASPVRRPPAVRTFLLASFPIALDGAGNILGLWTSPIGLRFATGVIWGAVLPAYFIAGLHDLAMRLPGFRTRPGGPRLNSPG